MKEQPKFDLLNFLRHFARGSCFGALAGLVLWVVWLPSGYTDLRLGVVCIVGMAALLGLLAGLRRERFWENAIDWLFPL